MTKKKKAAKKTTSKKAKVTKKKKKTTTTTRKKPAPAKPTALGEPVILDINGAQMTGDSEREKAAKALTVVGRVEITNNTELRTGLGWTAEIKNQASAVDEKRQGFIDPAKLIIDNANAFFKPALNDLAQCEKILKAKISEYVNGQVVKRDQLIAQVEAADMDQRTALLTEADAVMPPKLPGLTLVSGWKGEVTDAESLIAWAITHNRLDLLTPDAKALQAITKAKEGDPKIPGWTARPNTVVRVTVDKVQTAAELLEARPNHELVAP